MIRSQQMVLLASLAAFFSLAEANLAATVELSCSDAALVEGQQVHAIKYVQPAIPKTSEFQLLGDVRAKFSGDTCRIRVNPGSYRFDVLYKKRDGTVVALSTGKQDVSGDTKLKLLFQKPKPLQLLFKGEAIPIVRTQFRVPGTMNLEEVEGNAPQAIMSPTEAVKVRMIARKGGDKPIHAVIWADVDASKHAVEITDTWHSVCKFRSLCTDKVSNAKATFFLPEARRGMKAKGNNQVYEALYEGQNPDDLLVVDMAPDVTFLTNRRFVEMWYTYENSSGDTLCFTRRPILLPPNHAIAWGGDLRLTAHARVMMTWIKNTRAISWGADLINASGHRLNLPEDSVGLPGDDASLPDDTQIGWKQRLLRRDGRRLTLGKPGKARKKNDYGERTDADDFQLEEYVTEKQFPEAYSRLITHAVKGVNTDASDLFKVRVTYTLNGKKVEKEVACAPWVHYTSTHCDFSAPRGMNDVAFSAMDRTERTWFYGSAYPKKKQLDRITTRWTGCRWQGYSVGGSHSHVQLGMATFRRRHSLYGADWGPAHEYLHSWGYSHGREHGSQIARLRRHYRDHHIFLADHPEYEPEPVAMELDGKPITMAGIYESAVLP